MEIMVLPMTRFLFQMVLIKPSESLPEMKRMNFLTEGDHWRNLHHG
jgi:hypothetical protein